MQCDARILNLRISWNWSDAVSFIVDCDNLRDSSISFRNVTVSSNKVFVLFCSVLWKLLQGASASRALLFDDHTLVSVLLATIAILDFAIVAFRIRLTRRHSIEWKIPDSETVTGSRGGRPTDMQHFVF